MKFRGGEFSTGTKGNFQSELTHECLSQKMTHDDNKSEVQDGHLPTPSIKVHWKANQE